MAARTARAGQAVYFIAHAVPRTSAAAHKPVRAGRGAAARPGRAGPGRVSRARARQVSAMTGGSVMPRASGKASTGEAVANAASPSAAPRRRPAVANAAARMAKVAAASQGRGSPGQAGQAGGVGQAEQGHDRQVGVVGQPAAVGQGGQRQVGGGVLGQQGAGPGDHGGVGGGRGGEREPGQRGGQGTGQGGGQGRGAAAGGGPGGGQGGGGGVAGGGPDAPGPVVARAAEHRDRARVQREPRVPRRRPLPSQPGPEPGPEPRPGRRPPGQRSRRGRCGQGPHDPRLGSRRLAAHRPVEGFASTPQD